jgi:hypothetical protein
MGVLHMPAPLYVSVYMSRMCVCVCVQVVSGVDESDAGVELAAAAPASSARMRPPRTTLSLRLVPTRQPPLLPGGTAAPMSMATPGSGDETLAVSWWLYVSPADHIRSKPRASLSPRPAPAVSAVRPFRPVSWSLTYVRVCATRMCELAGGGTARAAPRARRPQALRFVFRVPSAARPSPPALQRQRRQQQWPGRPRRRRRHCDHTARER